MASSPRLIKRHDTHVQARALLIDENSTPINLTGLTVRYSMRHVKFRTLKVNRAAAGLADQAIYPGEVYYQYLSADVDTSGTYAEEWEVTYGDSSKETFPTGDTQLVRIVDDEDNT